MSMSIVEAINTLLDLIGEDTVSTSQIDGEEDAGRAERFLLRVSKEVQSSGWNVNTVSSYPITPDLTTGFILIPDTWLKVDLLNQNINVTIRRIDGVRYLYNKDQGTLKWVTSQSLLIEYVEYLPFEDLNYELQSYITYLAGMKFQQSVLGNEVTDKYIKEQVQLAYTNALQADTEQLDANILLNNPHSRMISWRNNMFWGS